MTALTPLKKYRMRVIFAPWLKVFECVCELAVPFIVRNIIDNVFSAGSSHYFDEKYLIWNVILIFGLGIAGFLATMVTQYLASDTCSKYNHDLKNELYTHLNTLTITQVNSYGKNKILNLITNDSVSMQTGVQMYMRLLLRAPFLVIGSVIASFLINWIFGCVVLGCLFLSAIGIFTVFIVTPKKYMEAQTSLDDATKITKDNLSGSRIVRAFSNENHQIEKFEQCNEAYTKKYVSISKLNSLVNPLTFMLVNLAVVFVLFISKTSIENNSFISVGSIVALISFLTQALAALLQFTKLITNLSKAYASKKRIDSFFALSPLKAGGSKTNFDKASDEVISMNNVCLNFGGDNVLDSISLSIKKGEKIGILGGTGSGKSILASLLNGLIFSNSGEICLYKENIDSYSLSAIRGEVSLVGQKPAFFKGTIKNNLCLGTKFSDEEISIALKKADAFEFVSKYEDFINHNVEENGSNLSGGQKQRLSLARGFLFKRDILILDEPFSALDYRTSSKIKANLKELDTTLIICSQRVSNLSMCDRVFVIDGGKIINEGTHEELSKSCLIYKEIKECEAKVNG